MAPTSSSQPFKVTIQKSVQACNALPRGEPSAKQTCPTFASGVKLKKVYDAAKKVRDLTSLAGKAVGVDRRAVGAARQVIRTGKLTGNQVKFVYGRAFAPTPANWKKTLSKGPTAVALGAAVAGVSNFGQVWRGEISKTNYAARVGYGAAKGAVSFAAGAAAAPLGAAIGAAVPPLGGAIGGSAIGYQVGKAFGGGKGAKVGAAVGAVVGFAAGFIPGAGPALGAVGAKLWMGEAVSEAADKYVGEEKVGRAADKAAQGVKNFFKW